MSITYPLSLPSSKIKRINLRANTRVGMVPSTFTNQYQVYEWSGQMWIAEVTLALMGRSDAAAWNAFLLKLNGPSGTFLMGDPSCATPLGSAPGTPVVNGSNQIGKVLLTKGWTISQTNILKAGDYIQIGNNLYMNLNDANSDSSGNASLDIFPRLRSSPTNNTTIITASTKGIWRLFDPEFPVYDVDEGKIFEVGFTAIEVVS